MIAIIDYDAGNLKSVEKALIHLGEEPIITRNYDELLKADKVILPGVGAFGDAMKKLHKYDLVKPIQEVKERKTPFLGICLGLQLMFESSDENPGVEGLSLLPGKIVRIPEQEGLKIPHMGWNSLSIKNGRTLFQGVDNEAYVYFVHSFYLKADNVEDVAATTHYSTVIDASVEHGQLFGCQFHPEKSGNVGLTILKNFAAIGKETI
ncbi:imidazole glycerol phosphate synthase subunit HisH [Anaeromicropila populeti]|uniref:Imidazole glycerol phosphate synthase subunit HisH n=1 Tax=Anaeromicropila populeti TaxID=37658 RepID=A0A1I6LPX6_9FIRM|nr:imidazole glycerol phosphate synthase subunit HisH [Anaeromicropila populeti]SFS05483.1 glutamine amidotransferase [Anaeromicropila populeti]